MTRGEIFSQKVMLAAQRLVEAEAPDLERVTNKGVQEGLGRSGGLVEARHERRMQTLKALLAERIRLEKDEKDYPLTPEDEGAWLYHLRSAIFGIIDHQAARLYPELESDCAFILGTNPEPFLRKAREQFDRLRFQYLHEADIMNGERELRKKASPPVAPSPSIILSINDSQISGLNVAGVVGSLRANLTSIQSAGAGRIAEAIKALAEAIANEPRLSDQTKRESLECMAVMGEELARPEGERRLGVLRAMGDALGRLIGHADKVYAGYELLKVAVKAGARLDLP